MRVDRLLLSVAVVTGFGLSACSSVAQTSGTQNVNVQVAGASNATCTFTNDTVSEKGQFPGKIKLARSRDDLQADCTGEGGKHVAFVVPAQVTQAGPINSVTNAMLPATAYDAATGGVYAYPDPVVVDFREIGETAGAANDSIAPATGDASVVMAPASAAHSAKMRPIMESATSASATASQAPAGGKMKPVASPEDKMGAEPGKVKAAARAKAEAAKRAKEEAAEKKRQAAAEAAAAKQAAEDAKAAAEMSATPAPAEATTTTTTPTTTTAAPAPVAPVPSNDAPPAEPVAPASTTTTTGAPTPITPGSNNDMDKYLEGQ